MSDNHGPDGIRGEVVPRRDVRRNDKLFRIADYEPVQPERIVSDLRSYWDGLRGNRSVPTRDEIDPRAFRPALDFAFILERIAPGAARFRLAGRHLIDVMGVEVRGMPICALLNPDSRGRLSDVLESVFRGPQIAELHLESAVGYGRPHLRGTMLFLPLRSDLGDVSRVLGCLVTKGEIGQTSRRFDLVRDRVFPVVHGAKTIEPSPSPTRFAELAPARGRIFETATPEERRAKFRVITDGIETSINAHRM
ncbi:PAS domain-containing protein [Paracoccus aestuariivivens]|uniref:PAS domain-containing protein n=1 Tax=Paracoccus aestuariivivens TaxID=1820333 RepID=A0A6L6JFA1_9RHOB|nr:PAS domain-containing protein [Paracoccus aestuariivivens]MTH78814.1 PAS domain-containing protein [Paracoccus aestuariivivens]